MGFAAHAVVRPFYSLTKPRLPLQLPSLLIERLGRGRWSGDGAAVVCHTEFLSSVPNILLCHLATVGCVCKRILRASTRSTVVDISSTRTPPALSHTLSAAPSSRTAAAMSMIDATPHCALLGRTPTVRLQPKLFHSEMLWQAIPCKPHNFRT